MITMDRETKSKTTHPSSGQIRNRGKSEDKDNRQAALDRLMESFLGGFPGFYGALLKLEREKESR